MWPSQVFVVHAGTWVGAGMREDPVKQGLGVQEQVPAAGVGLAVAGRQARTERLSFRLRTFGWTSQWEPTGVCPPDVSVLEETGG